MGIVYQKDKRSGITYAYESKAYWDKEKKQSRAKRKLIGRVDEATGEIVPTDGRVRKARERAAEPDYKALYEQAMARIAELEAELAELRG
ncbi:MAG: hypothetical protein IJ087_06315 [Eggerthellaceae bacterium]|nr:hypothetical protein [Eggerthellaceae bacterium]